jgi:hypothetical protein
MLSSKNLGIFFGLGILVYSFTTSGQSQQDSNCILFGRNFLTFCLMFAGQKLFLG